MEVRLREVEKMLVLHIATGEIVRRIAQKFNVSDRTARYDIQRVYALWDEQSRLERPARRSQMRATLRKLLQLAIQENDVKAAVLVCDRIAKLDGLDAPTEIHLQHSGSIEQQMNLGEFTDAELTVLDQALSRITITADHAGIDRDQVGSYVGDRSDSGPSEVN